jgi:hypothetical protein
MNLLSLGFKLLGEEAHIREVIQLTKPVVAELQKVWPELSPLIRDIGQRSRRAYVLAKPTIAAFEHAWPDLKPQATALMQSFAPEIVAQWGKEVPLPAFSVRWLQESLNKLGADPQLAVDGKRGEATDLAVEQFQKRSGFRPGQIDGWAGPLTTAAILRALPP